MCPLPKESRLKQEEGIGLKCVSWEYLGCVKTVDTNIGMIMH